MQKVSFENALRARFGERLLLEEPLAPYTTFRIGGPAQFLVAARTSSDVVEASALARRFEQPFYFLAGCSNVLISDAGLRGLVVINKSDGVEWGGDSTARAAGGCNLDRFVAAASQRGWGDLSFAAGIPGSLGGALAGGAGAFGHLVCEYLREAKILRPDGSVVTQSAAALGIQYRTSEVKMRRDIILEAVMGPFVPGDAKELIAACDRIHAERESKHPGSNLPCAGSFFKNLPPAEPGGRRLPAGKYLEEAGVKTLRFGDAGVFEKHANIIVNYGCASAADVDRLAEAMARRVREKFGIILEREVQYLC